MRGKVLSVLFLFLALVPASAQKTLVDGLEKDVPGQGKVRVIRDERLDSLIGFSFDVTQASVIKATGYRIQAYAGNNTRDAREQATKVQAYIREHFPEYPVYVEFKSPRWLCTVGDFLYYEEANEVLRRLKAETSYKGLIILRNQEINLPL